jgi:streptogramin lyase
MPRRNTPENHSSQRQPLLLILALLAGLVLYNACKKSDEGHPTLSITPDSGPAGNLVTITGSGFNTDPTLDSVTFNGTPALIANATATRIQVLVPAGATTGPVVVYVNGQSITGPTYTISPISIGALSLSQGLTGDSVTISGMGLSNSGSLSNLAGLPAVKFNGKVATVVSATPTQVVALVPARAETGVITVSIGGQTATGPVFNYLGIDTLHPATGNVGTLITLTGGFGTSPAQDTVMVNGVKAVIDSATPTKLVVTIPTGATTGNVVVRTGGRTILGSAFTFVAPPTAASILPSSGPAGIRVAITGTGFSKIPTENTVAFNGVPGIVDSASPGSLVVTVPPGATTGQLQVAVNNQAVKGPLFTVQSLSVTVLSSAFFIPPFTDTIRGTGFSTNLAQDIVQFNGVNAAVVSATDTELVVNIPAGVTSGKVNVSVGSLSAASYPFSTMGVMTFAGSTNGLADGQGNQAQFAAPDGLAVDAAGNIWLADAGANNIREISPTGLVSNFAGDPGGSAGYTDAQGAAAQFSSPNAIAVDKSGNLYVADQGNSVVRKITAAGVVSTFTTLPSGDAPGGVAVDAAGNVYVTDVGYGNGNVYTYSPAGALTNTIFNSNAQQLGPIAVDAAGNIYTSDLQTGNVFQGTKIIVSNLSTQFGSFPVVLAIAPGGNLIVTGGRNAQVYSVNPAANFALTTLTGGAGVKGNTGYQDGPLSSALFAILSGVAVDARGIIYVSDQIYPPYVVQKISLQ